MAVTPDESALTAKLHATTDGMVWATEFCNLFLVVNRENGEPQDEGLMVGWFANAIEIGRSAGEAKASVERSQLAALRAAIDATAAPFPQELIDELADCEPADEDGA